MTLVKYSIKGRVLAEKLVEGTPLISAAYCCTTCGEIWGRVAAVEENPVWQFLHIPCEEHAPNGITDGVWRIPGSLLCPFRQIPYGLQATSLEEVPVEVLRREVLIHIKAYENRPT